LTSIHQFHQLGQWQIKKLIQIDTTNILFICGGAFDGLEQIIKRRLGKKVIGFGSDGQRAELRQGDTLKMVLPEDLLKFGLIPEFVGRLPVLATLEQLDEAALIRILTEPKNALIKQYQKLLELDNVSLEFQAEALDWIAKEAIKRNTGARGLRAIIESGRTDLEVVSINDLGPVETNAHLMRYDSVHGRFPGQVKVAGDTIDVGFGPIKVTAIKNPSELPHKELGVDIALECTGIFVTKEKAAAHLTAGAKRVIVSAPCDNADLTVVYGVNHDKLTKDHVVISNASCTTNCRSPLRSTSTASRRR